MQDDESNYSRRQATIAFRLAQRSVALADQVAAELVVKQKGSSTLQIILARAKATASDALADLVDVEPTNTSQIIALQAKVKMFREMVTFMAEAIREGDSARHDLDTMTQEEIAALVVDEDGVDDT